MVGILGELTNFVINIVSNLGYPGIVLAMFAENIFPPIPSEAIMPMAGYLVTIGRFNFFLTIFSGVLGTLIGAVALYYIGVGVGNLKFRKFLDRYGRFLMTTSKDLEAAERWFGEHGEKSVLLARVIPLIRSIISIPAGFTKMPLKKFVIFTTIGSAAWTTLLTAAGVVLGDNWEKVGPIMNRFDFVVVGVIVILVGYYIFRKMSNGKCQRSKPHVKSVNV